MNKLSVTEFKKIIRERTENICQEHNFKWSTEVHRGYAFQIWIANIISSYEQSFETFPEDSVLTSKDLKADIVFDDPVNKQLLICQCKFLSLSKKKDINEDEVVSFFDRHHKFMDRKWIESNGSREVINCLADYREKVENGYSIIYRFISTGNSSERINSLADSKNTEYIKNNIDIQCELMDFKKLKDYYVRAKSLEETIPEEIIFYIQELDMIVVNEPYKTMIGVISGNHLRSMYGVHKESLFAYNIRNYLGNKGINADIKETAVNSPDHFMYFNNGISAICTSFEIEGNKITVKNFQIINGAQTVGTIAKCPASDELKVLIRLTVGENVKTEKGFNQKVIQYNNTQNAIKISDFRSNDSIQLWLEQKIEKQKSTDVIKKYRYVRKRTFKRVSGKVSIKLEDFAKIRYSYFYEPTKCLNLPRSLWTSEEDGGVYEKSFGVNGKLEAQWSDEEFYESLVATAVYYEFIKEAKVLGEKSDDFKYMNRLKWHSQSLAGIFRRGKKQDLPAIQLLNNKKKFEELWDEYWNIAKVILDEVYTRAIEDKTTIYAFVRSVERWQSMKTRMEKRILM